ncbi:MAG: class I SAM-dependent methyltransferase [Nanoarchaeota archaeon]|nr:class I SAM-dependent methyltransferase [Nanoarchaeota archaeon]
MEKINDDRSREIYEYIVDKDVLDIGCFTDFTIIDNPENIWIYGFLKKYAKSVTGIDIDKEGIKELKKRGYDVHFMSAEDFKFNKKRFDVIFAGDVIEHLSNPGLFLDRAKEHLKKEGYLIISTPNIFCLNYKIGGIIRLLNNDLSVNSEHTIFFSPTVIKTLLNRHGFVIEKYNFVNFHKIDTFKRLVQDILCNILGKHLKYTMMIFAKHHKINK